MSEIKLRLPQASRDKTVGERQDKLIEKLIAGHSRCCDLCGQNAKVYSRRLNAGLLRALGALRRRTFLTAKEMANVSGSRDYPFLAHFGLAEKHVSRGWCLTHAGLNFVDGHTSYYDRVVVYDNQRLAFAGKLVSFKQQAEEFDLGELLDPVEVANLNIAAE